MHVNHEVRRDHRLARVIKGSITGIAGKATTLLANAISLPIAVRYLGPQQYGFWVTISTTIAMFSVMDLGVAYSLTNFISRAYAEDDRAAARRYYATAFWTSTAISALIAIIAWRVWPLINWGNLFHVTDAELVHEVSLCVAIALAFFLISIPLNLVHKVLGGYQQTQLTNYFNIFRNIISLIAIAGTAWMRGSLPTLIFAYSSSLLAGTIALNLWMNLWDRPWIFPSPLHVNKSSVRQLLNSGSSFFALQLAGLIVFNSDNIVITHFLGAAEVAPYSVAWRLAGYAVVLQSSISPSLWPAYAEAYARGDLRWIRDAFWRMARMVGTTTFLGLAFFAIFGHTLLRWYVGPAATASYPLIWVICGWTMISAGMDLEATLLAAVGRVRMQGILSLVAATCNLFLSIYLVKRAGSIGVVLGTAISYIIFLIVPQTLIVWDVLYPHATMQDRKRHLRIAFSRLTHWMGEKVLPLIFTPTVYIARAIGRLPKPPSTPERTLLVIHPTPHLGDSVMLMPLLEQLHHAHPDRPLELAIGSGVAIFFQQLPWIKRVYAIPTPKAKAALFGSRSILKIVNLTRIYKRELAHVSAEVCLLPRWNNDQFRAHYLAYLLGIKRRIGWKSASAYYSDRLLTEKYSGGSGQHEAERFCLLAESADLIPPIKREALLSCPITSMRMLSEVTPWEPLASRIGIHPSQPIAVIAPGASAASRRWPVGRWTHVIDWLRDQGLEVMIVSGLADADVARQLHQLDQNRAKLLAGELNLLELAALMRHATIFLGNDSGPGHVAGAVGITTVILFSSSPDVGPDETTSPARIGPVGPNVIPCQPKQNMTPCYGQCRHENIAHCIENIEITDVIAVLQSLKEASLRKPSMTKGGAGSNSSSALSGSIA